MRILMLGWELPPYNTGGLGTATHGLASGLADLGAGVSLVLPKVYEGMGKPRFRLLDASAMLGGGPLPGGCGSGSVGVGEGSEGTVVGF
jgi:hypothetical protein